MRHVAWILLALAACQAQGDYTRAASEEARANMDRLHAGTEYDQALRQFESGDFARALDTVNSCIARIPQAPKGHLLRARILIEQGELSAARAALQGGAELAPDDSEFPYLEGVVHEQLGDLEAAVVAYQRASSLEPGRAEVMLAEAEVLAQLGRVDEARALLDTDAGEFAGHAGFRQTLGHLVLLEGDLDQAAQLFGEAAILSPADPAILEDLARAQVALGKCAEALHTLALIQPGARRQNLRRLQAYCFVQNRQPVEARSLLLELTSAEGGARDRHSWELMADVALMLNDDRLLRTAAERLIQTGPECSEGYLALALWKRRTGDLKGALLSTREAMRRAPEDPTPAQLEQILLRDPAVAGE